jgi:hypothetical protein
MSHHCEFTLNIGHTVLCWEWNLSPFNGNYAFMLYHCEFILNMGHMVLCWNDI